MMQPDLFEGGASATPAAANHAAQGAAADKCPCSTLENAKSSECCAECSADARKKVDAKALRQLCLEEYTNRVEGATADEICKAVSYRTPVHIDELSIRPRVADLKKEGILVDTGRKHYNKKMNPCAVLIHRRYTQQEAA